MVQLRSARQLCSECNYLWTGYDTGHEWFSGDLIFPKKGSHPTRQFSADQGGIFRPIREDKRLDQMRKAKGEEKTTAL